MKFGFQMVWYSNGWYISPTMRKLDQYLRNQGGAHLSGIQMAGLSCIQMAFENQTIWHPTSFQPLSPTASILTSLDSHFAGGGGLSNKKSISILLHLKILLNKRLKAALTVDSSFQSKQ